MSIEISLKIHRERLTSACYQMANTYKRQGCKQKIMMEKKDIEWTVLGEKSFIFTSFLILILLILNFYKQ